MTEQSRPELLKRAIRLEYVTVGWNVAEGVIAVAAGAIASSAALIGFGLDSFIEVTAAVALIWRLKRGTPEEESEAERTALKIVGWTFFALAAYVTFEAVKDLWTKDPPGESIPGIVIALLSGVTMPFLARLKRKVGVELGSRALQADATETAVCAWLSWILLAGLGLNAAFGWWWADPVASLGIALILVKEGREALEGEGCECR